MYNWFSSRVREYIFYRKMISRDEYTENKK
jgi:hypothetical protein